MMRAPALLRSRDRAVTAPDRLYVADSGNNRIVEVTPLDQIVWQYVTNLQPGSSFTLSMNVKNLGSSTAHNVTLTIGAARAVDAGAYSVVVSNAGGSVTSSAAALTVVDPALTIAGPGG